MSSTPNDEGYRSTRRARVCGACLRVRIQLPNHILNLNESLNLYGAGRDSIYGRLTRVQ